MMGKTSSFSPGWRMAIFALCSVFSLRRGAPACGILPALFSLSEVLLMRQVATLSLLLLSVVLTSAAQTNIQLTPVPPKPTCTPILTNGACANLWQNYNQALGQRQREELQLYVNRQKELATSAATAPLQQQITDLNKLVTDQQDQIKKLQDQMQADATAALQAVSQTKESDAEARKADADAALAAKSAAHRQ